MNPVNLPSSVNQAITILGPERWSIYHRLQELDIPCQCSLYQPISVQISSPTHLLQVWSVVKRLTTTQSELARFLNGCWKVSVDKVDK